VAVGEPLVSIETTPDASAAEHAGSASAPEGSGSGPVLVGYGPDGKPGVRRRARRRTSSTDSPGTSLVHDAFGTGRRPASDPESALGSAPVSAPQSGPASGVAARPAPGGEDGQELTDRLPDPGDLDVQRIAAAPEAQVPDAGTQRGRRQRAPLRDADITPTVEPVSPLRAASAAAVTASAQQVPQAAVWREVDLTAALALLDQSPPAAPTPAPTMLSLLARACCLALRDWPSVNGRWLVANGQPGIEQRPRVDLGIATATERGLLVPVVRDAAGLSAAQLAERIAAMARRAREGHATPDDLVRPTFTISNVGVFGVDGGVAILPPSTTAILVVGVVGRRARVVGDSVEPRPMVTLSLTFDHRVLDGEQGAGFLADVADLLERPGLALLR
jgi:2-oxoisovalerate dehydrogenase E2 component (dihydrolipoyl transacylase)